METLNYPRDEELDMDFEKIEEAHELPTERIERILAGEENIGFFTYDELKETLLRRKMAALEVEEDESAFDLNPNLLAACALVIFIIFAFFGWTLYKSLRDKEKKREEKKKLKQKKKK